MSILQLEEDLMTLKQDALAELSRAQNQADLENIRLTFLGQKGKLTSILRGLSALDKNDRPRLGQVANDVKDAIHNSLEAKKDEFVSKELEIQLEAERIDVTLPPRGTRAGHIHPLTQVTEDIIDIFYSLGFSVEEGPEVETDYYNFDSLNTPADHPARDSQDTFYTSLGENILLRSQTSTVQIRVMEKQKPPLKFISPGRVYRNEEINARKYPLFHQVEGLYVDTNVTFGQLKGTLSEFIRLFFGKELKTRFRPDFFPFTEPSAELDCQCPFCLGKGCKTCGHRGWLEILGCGMIDPAVLSGVGINPEEWSGFAFGMGIERLAMLKYGVNDIRHFFSSDLRFLEQF